MKKLRASVRSHKKLPANPERRGKCALSSSQAKPSAPDGKELGPCQSVKGLVSLAVQEDRFKLAVYQGFKKLILTVAV